MYIKLYLALLSVMFAIDGVWLGLVAKNFYSKHLGFLMKSNVNWTAALGFYLLFILGLIVLVINPAVNANSWQKAALFGALFGLVSYATYDLSNLATLKSWPVIVTIVDLIWGTFVTTTLSLIGFFLANKLK